MVTIVANGLTESRLPPLRKENNRSHQEHEKFPVPIGAAWRSYCRRNLTSATGIHINEKRRNSPQNEEHPRSLFQRTLQIMSAVFVKKIKGDNRRAYHMIQNTGQEIVTAAWYTTPVFQKFSRLRSRGLMVQASALGPSYTRRFVHRRASPTFRLFVADTDRAPPAGRNRRCDFQDGGASVEH
ncbi:hypothetical protein EVAR_97150_1 [Eumeta japonica]|uniref:Uncharacterized protein n=1 Tax=Eumeta variegata TaxID=151549 RepID=A0A4C1XVD5_EUMVA|nr:hypothetical protein EVAR_97150_1 [Eumeta japonica]